MTTKTKNRPFRYLMSRGMGPVLVPESKSERFFLAPGLPSFQFSACCFHPGGPGAHLTERRDMMNQKARLNAWVRTNRKKIEKFMRNPELWEKALKLVGLK